MTTPVTPSKLKTYIALAGTILSAAVPLVLSVADYLPPEWAAVLAAVLSILTTLGVYKAPYVPKDAVLVPEDVVTAPRPPTPSGGFKNPWR